MESESRRTPETYAGKTSEIESEIARFEALESEFVALESREKDATVELRKEIDFVRFQMESLKSEAEALDQAAEKTPEAIDKLYATMATAREALDRLTATYLAEARLLQVKNEYKDEPGVRLLDEEYVKENFGPQLAEVAKQYEQNKGSLAGVDLKALEDLRQQLGVSEAEFGPILEEMMGTAHGGSALHLYNEEKKQESGMRFSERLARLAKNMPQRVVVSMATTAGITQVAAGLGIGVGFAGTAGTAFAAAGVLAGGRWAWQKYVANSRKLKGYQTSVSQTMTADEAARDEKQKNTAEQYQGNLVNAVRFKKAEQLEVRKREAQGGRGVSNWEDIRQKFVKGEIKDRDQLRAELIARKEQFEKKVAELAAKDNIDPAEIEAAQKKLMELNDALQVFYFTESSLELEKQVAELKTRQAEQKAAPKVEDLVKKGHGKKYLGYAAYGGASRIVYRLMENSSWLPWLQKSALAAGGAYAGYKLTEEAMERWGGPESKIKKRGIQLGGVVVGGLAAGWGGGELLDYTREQLKDYFAKAQAGEGGGKTTVKIGHVEGVDDASTDGSGANSEIGHTSEENVLDNPHGVTRVGDPHAAPDHGPGTSPAPGAPPVVEKVSLREIVERPEFKGASMEQKYAQLEELHQQGGLARWEDEIRTPEGSTSHDSVWASTRSLLKLHAAELGIDKEGAELEQWAETQTANLVKQLGLDEGGRVLDLVHNGDRVYVYEGADHKLYLRFEAASGEEAGYLPESKPATSAERVEAVPPPAKPEASPPPQVQEIINAQTIEAQALSEEAKQRMEVDERYLESELERHNFAHLPGHGPRSDKLELYLHDWAEAQGFSDEQADRFVDQIAGADDKLTKRDFIDQGLYDKSNHEISTEKLTKVLEQFRGEQQPPEVIAGQAPLSEDERALAQNKEIGAQLMKSFASETTAEDLKLQMAILERTMPAGYDKEILGGFRLTPEFAAMAGNMAQSGEFNDTALREAVIKFQDIASANYHALATQEGQRAFVADLKGMHPGWQKFIYDSQSGEMALVEQNQSGKIEVFAVGEDGLAARQKLYQFARPDKWDFDPNGKNFGRDILKVIFKTGVEPITTLPTAPEAADLHTAGAGGPGPEALPPVDQGPAGHEAAVEPPEAAPSPSDGGTGVEAPPRPETHVALAAEFNLGQDKFEINQEEAQAMERYVQAGAKSMLSLAQQKPELLSQLAEQFGSDTAGAQRQLESAGSATFIGLPGLSIAELRSFEQVRAMIEDTIHEAKNPDKSLELYRVDKLGQYIDYLIHLKEGSLAQGTVVMGS